MPELLLIDLPDELHRRLRERAARNRHSVSQEAILLLEQALGRSEAKPTEPPAPFQGRFPITDEWLDAAKRSGRH